MKVLVSGSIALQVFLPQRECQGTSWCHLLLCWHPEGSVGVTGHSPWDLGAWGWRMWELGMQVERMKDMGTRDGGFGYKRWDEGCGYQR